MNKRIHIAVILAVCAIAMVMTLYWNTGTLWGNQYDDSYITYRYAVNLAEHGAMEFNLGERTDAASSFLYTVILAGFFRTGLHNMETVSFLLNMLSIGLIAAFVFLCAFRLSKSGWISIVLGMIAATHGCISGWSVLGMETVPFAAMLCVLLWAIIERRDTLSLILIIAVVLMRVEGFLVVPFWWFASGRNVRNTIIVTGIIILFYGAKYAYFGTVLPHSYLAKNMLLYYKPNPGNILNIWKSYALIAPLFAIAGIFAERRIWWLGTYIALAGIFCFEGPHSDWARYSVPLFPLCLIAGAPTLRRPEFAFVVCSVLTIQGWDSVKWMRYQAASLAPVQEIRASAGKWLQKHADRYYPVLSGDIGAIAYFAPDIRFIDTFGLTSSDVITAYRSAGNMDSIIRVKCPEYIADTYSIKDGNLFYTHGNGSFIFGGKPSRIPASHAVWGKQFNNNSAIIIAKINEVKK